MIQTHTMSKIENTESETGALVKVEAVGNTIGDLATRKVNLDGFVMSE